MKSVTTFIDGLIPKEITKRLRRAPIIVRLYSGSTCMITHKVRVAVDLKRTTCIVGPCGGHISIKHPSFDGSWDITRCTFSLDMPVLDKFESPIQMDPMTCPTKELIITPKHPGLLAITTEGWG